MDKEGFLAEAVARAPECLLKIVPKGECEHAVDPFQAVTPPGVPGAGEHFRVGAGTKGIAHALKCLAQFDMVVDLPVMDNVVPAEAVHGLGGIGGGVGDGQSPMGEAEFKCFAGYGIHTLAVGPAVT